MINIARVVERRIADLREAGQKHKIKDPRESPRSGTKKPTFKRKK